MKLKFTLLTPLEICFCMASFFAKFKFSDFGQSPWFDFSESKKSCEKSIASYRERKEKSNGACFSCVAPSSRAL